MESRRVKLTFIDEILGTNPGRPDVHAEFIASKAPDAETREQELEHEEVDAIVDRETTKFYRDPVTKQPELSAHMVKGFFKAACQAYRNNKKEKSASASLTAYKKKIDQNIFVFPDANNKASRMIPITVVGEIKTCQRPLRAQTMQGERVALASSESIGPGSTIEFDIETSWSDYEKVIEEWLDYGVYNGLGQWRNAGKGAFTWEYVSAK